MSKHFPQSSSSPRESGEFMNCLGFKTLFPRCIAKGHELLCGWELRRQGWPALVYFFICCYSIHACVVNMYTWYALGDKNLLRGSQTCLPRHCLIHKCLNAFTQRLCNLTPNITLLSHSWKKGVKSVESHSPSCASVVSVNLWYCSSADEYYNVTPKVKIQQKKTFHKTHFTTHNISLKKNSVKSPHDL